MPQFRVRFALALALTGLGCATGETGDPCWDDSQCSSWGCSYGSCDSDWLLLIEDVVHEVVSSQADEGGVPRCDGLDQFTCTATEGCVPVTSCTGDLACFYAGGGDCYAACGVFSHCERR